MQNNLTSKTTGDKVQRYGIIDKTWHEEEYRERGERRNVPQGNVGSGVVVYLMLRWNF